MAWLVGVVIFVLLMLTRVRYWPLVLLCYVAGLFVGRIA